LTEDAKPGRDRAPGVLVDPALNVEKLCERRRRAGRGMKLLQATYRVNIVRV